MKEPLYYCEPYKWEFEAKVLEVKHTAEGYATLLSQTAFYPGGGGQPPDEGILNEQQVLKLEEVGDGIYHYTKEAFQVGEIVRGIIHHERRLDFMKQHSGEHILSGLIHKLYGFDNVGFHLNEKIMTADFNGLCTEEELEKVEALANNAITENQRIKSEWFLDDEVQQYDYRSKKVLKGYVRLVEVENYDTCACCGVHVERAGEIGLIKIIGSERYKGGMRLTVLCGERALEDYTKRLKVTKALSEQCSKPLEALEDTLIKMLTDKKELEYKLWHLKEALIESESIAVKIDTPLCLVKEDEEGATLKLYYKVLKSKMKAPFLVLVPKDEGYQYVLGGEMACIQAIQKELKEQLGAKGGGKEMIQGTLLGQYDQIEALFKKLTK